LAEDLLGVFFKEDLVGAFFVDFYFYFFRSDLLTDYFLAVLFYDFLVDLFADLDLIFESFFLFSGVFDLFRTFAFDFLWIGLLFADFLDLFFETVFLLF
jgi:hypothetical protein